MSPCDLQPIEDAHSMLAVVVRDAAAWLEAADRAIEAGALRYAERALSEEISNLYSLVSTGLPQRSTADAVGATHSALAGEAAA